MSGVALVEDDGEGDLKMSAEGFAPFKLSFADAVDAGDGTVPATSGSAPAGSSVAARFRHGSEGRGEFARMNAKGRTEGYEHQASYEDHRTQWATLYSLVRIAGNADWA